MSKTRMPRTLNMGARRDFNVSAWNEELYESDLQEKWVAINGQLSSLHELDELIAWLERAREWMKGIPIPKKEPPVKPKPDEESFPNRGSAVRRTKPRGGILARVPALVKPQT